MCQTPSIDPKKGNAMETYEYASFWIWDTRNVGREVFDRLRALTARGWQVVGSFLEMPEVDPNAGLWMLRRRVAVAQADEELSKAA